MKFQRFFLIGTLPLFVTDFRKKAFNMQSHDFMKVREISKSKMITLYSKESNLPISTALYIGKGFYMANTKENIIDNCYGMKYGNTSKMNIIGEPYKVKGTSLVFFEVYNDKEIENPPEIGLSHKGVNESIGNKCYIIGRNKQDNLQLEKKIIIDNAKGDLQTQELPSEILEGSFILDENGKILGINNSGNKFYPSNFIEPIVNQFLSNGEVKRPFLGLTIKNSSNKDGAFIVKVVPGSPAEKSGITFASLITEINGISISSAEEFLKIVGFEEKGEIKCSIQTGGKVKSYIIKF